MIQSINSNFIRNLKVQKLKFKHFINKIVMNPKLFYNFVSMEFKIRKSNPMVILSNSHPKKNIE